MSPTELSDPWIGQVLAGRFRIVRKLGAGGMGSVYEALQLAMDRPVAVKLIHPDIAASDEAAARFHREMQTASRVEHPNTIRIYDYGTARNGQLFLAMELLEGRTLRHALAADGRMPIERVVRIALQVARALGAAHSEGIVHRDLKPDNVMLLDRYGERDVVKVLDFGVARFIAEGPTEITVEGAVIGTPSYMSPEQAQGKPVDHRADLYSFGVMLYQMATGRLPFEGASLVDLVVAHSVRMPAPPSEIAPGRVPPPLEELIVKLLAKLPEERGRDAAELCARLERIAASTGYATPASPVSSDRPAAPAGPADTAPDVAFGATVSSVSAGATVPEVSIGGPDRGGSLGASPPRRAGAAGVITAVALALAALATAGMLALRGPRASSEARAELDRRLAAERDPPAPEACRTRDRETVALLARATAPGDGGVALAPLEPPDPAAPAELWALLARARLAAGQVAPARDAAARASSLCPGYAFALDVAGNVEQKAGERAAAEAFYRQALEAAPGYTAPRFNLGLLALRNGDPAGAVIAFDEVLRNDPARPHVHLVRGQARLLVGDAAAAAKDLEEAVRREPSHDGAWLLLGQARRKLGDEASARAAFCRARQLGNPAAEPLCDAAADGGS